MVCPPCTADSMALLVGDAVPREPGSCCFRNTGPRTPGDLRRDGFICVPADPRSGLGCPHYGPTAVLQAVCRWRASPCGLKGGAGDGL